MTFILGTGHLNSKVNVSHIWMTNISRNERDGEMEYSVFHEKETKKKSVSPQGPVTIKLKGAPSTKKSYFFSSWKNKQSIKQTNKHAHYCNWTRRCPLGFYRNHFDFRQFPSHQTSHRLFGLSSVKEPLSPKVLCTLVFLF